MCVKTENFVNPKLRFNSWKNNMLSDVFAFLLNCCSFLFNFHILVLWGCDLKDFSCVWTQFGVCTLSYLHQGFFGAVPVFLPYTYWNRFCFFSSFSLCTELNFNHQISECCSHQLVAAQVFYSLWGWLWVVLDGRRLWVCATAASYSRTTPQVQWQWHCTCYYCYYTTTTNTISSTHLYTFIHVRLHPSNSLLLSSCRCCIHPLNLSVHLSSHFFLPHAP